MIKSKKTD